jgi:hypothetical protein
MTDDELGLAAEIEHHPAIEKVREEIRAVRADMPPSKRALLGFVLKAVRDHLRDDISSDPVTIRALLLWALLHLVEEAEAQTATAGNKPAASAAG